MQPADLFDHLKAIVPPDDALRMVRAKHPSFSPSPVRPVISPRMIDPQEPADPTILAQDVALRKVTVTFADALLRAIHREHPKIMRNLREHGEAMRALGKSPAPNVVYP